MKNLMIIIIDQPNKQLAEVIIQHIHIINY